MKSFRKYPGVVLGTALFLVVCGVFLPALRNDFISFDDRVYVTQNPHVRDGLSVE